MRTPDYIERETTGLRLVDPIAQGRNADEVLVSSKLLKAVKKPKTGT